MAKQRLDLIMLERGLAESRSAAQRLVMAGQVRVNGELQLKPSALIAADARIEVARGPAYVSRGGEKLQAALEAFGIDVGGRVCADLGASTGGFTDCLLQHGARRVYAIDVGKGILHWKLRQDPRVVVMEGVNARYLANLPEAIELVTVDASFISLKNLLPVISGWFAGCAGGAPGGEGRESEGQGMIVALVKPQFEAGRAEAGRGEGVIRDPRVHRRVLTEVLDFAQQLGFHASGLIRSPLRGPKGNLEFLAWLEWRTDAAEQAGEAVGRLIDRALE